MSNYKTRFLNGFEILTHSRHPYEVWQDLMRMFANSISNATITPLKNNEEFEKVWNKREKEYLDTINKYTKKEQKIIPQMFALLVQELEENPKQDLLGSIYMMANISNKNTGQFFTPYDVCELMAKISFDRKNLGKIVHKNGYASVNDCACGGGATLIAAVNECKDMFKKYNYQNHVYFIGQDIDITCAQMCYIQLSLLGVAGYVVIGNTLTEPVITDLNRVYFTPVWFSDVWTMRRLFHNQDIFGRERG